MTQTPEWWLQRLASRLDRKRSELAHLRRYLDGDPPLPEGAEGCREAYRAFQRKARTNYAELITEAVTDRMRPAHFRVGDSNEDDDDARRLWLDNRLNIWAGEVHHDMVGLRGGYVCVQHGEGDDVDITYERPEQCITDHDPKRPDRVRAALKVYRDDVEGIDVAYVHLRGVKGERSGTVTRFVRPTPRGADGVERPIESVSGGWSRDGDDVETGLYSVPIVPFPNRRGLSEFETHTDLLDRINWTILQRLVITAMQAYRQRAVKGDLPEEDEEGNAIDYAEVFRPGPGALWRLPEGVELWESAQTSIGEILMSVKDDLRDLAAVTRTELSALMPDGQNQTAEGAANAKERAVSKAEDRIERARTSWAKVIRLALALKRGSEDEVPEVDVLFAPPDRPSMSERYDALSKVGDDMPWRSKMTHILGFDGDTVDRMAAERAEDMALAAAFAFPEEGEEESEEAPADDDNEE